MENFRVTARLQTGIVCDQWIPLDGILLYQACRNRFGSQATTTPGGTAPPEVQLPLRIIHPGKLHWYYACSWAQPQPWWVAEGQDHWNKRFDSKFADMVDFDSKRGKVIIEQGRYKAYHMPIFYYVADVINWHCVGDAARIEELLSTVSHLGKKSSQGWGRVSRWTVETQAEDWSVRRDGKLTRGVPACDAEGPANFVQYGLRPSYYRKENQMLVVMPDGR